MNFNDIKNEIKSWNEIVISPQALAGFLSEGNCFTFDFTIPLNYAQSPLHVYPAISNNRLVFYLISSINDNVSVYQSSGAGFVDYIVKAEVTTQSPEIIGGEGINREEALQRIYNWENFFEDWIVDEVKTGEMFEAFEIPVISIPSGAGLSSFFALRDSTDPSTNPYTADLIITDSLNLLFYDTVRPVPPFGQGGEAAFFILEESLKV